MRWLLTGASGQLGSYLLRELLECGETVIAWSRSPAGPLFGVDLQAVDLGQPEAVARSFAKARPAVVLHTAALASVGACYGAPDQAERVNVEGSRLLAELAAERNARLLLVSTDLVFDGRSAPYRESDSPAPLSVYGHTKAAAEQAVLQYKRQCVVRVSLLFGPAINGRPAFFDKQLDALRNRTPCTLFEDEWRTPLSLQTAATGLIGVACSDYRGLLHMGGPERMSRLEMGRRLAGALGLDGATFQRGRRCDARAPEPRPCDVSLDSSRWRACFPQLPWPDWKAALDQLFS